MFDFFKALFGGAYYIGKLSNEKSRIREYDRKWEAYQSLYNRTLSRIGASPQTCQAVTNKILSGKYYDEICEKYKDDFRFVLGVNWKESLLIPPVVRCTEKALYQPSSHVYWVYHLMLASQGKMDDWALHSGFSIGGRNVAKTDIKFAQCIEGQLLNAGITDIRLALELENICGKQRNSSEPYGGKIKIAELATYPTHRLWDDYIAR